MTVLERRRVHLLVADTARAAVLAEEDGGLPRLDLEFPTGGTTATATVAALRALGIDRPLLDCWIDQTEVAEGEPIGVVVQFDAPDPVPAGWRWVHCTAVRPPAARALREYVDVRVDELLGRRAIPGERSPWVQSGWFERVRPWIDDRLVHAGHGPSTDVTPFRIWGISAVFSVTSEHGRHWFKAVIPHFAAEPVVTDHLSRLAPRAVPKVIAVEPDEGWLLLEHLEGTGIITATAPAEAIAGLVRLQRAFAGREDELRRCGVPSRPLSSLVDDLRDSLEMPHVRAALEVPELRVETILRGLAVAVARVEALGFPDTLVHGDFHPNNVTLDGAEVVVFDWSDASVGNPMVDIGAWGSWLRDDPPALDDLWRCVAAAWAPTVDPAAVRAVRPSADAVVGAYHAVSYARIAGALEPLRREEAMSGWRSFFADMTVALDAAAAGS